jgi:hypothetical protein
LPAIDMSSDFTDPAFQEMARLPKALNRHDFLLPGMLLAAITEGSVRIAQPRSRSINEIDPP